MSTPVVYVKQKLLFSLGTGFLQEENDLLGLLKVGNMDLLQVLYVHMYGEQMALP